MFNATNITIAGYVVDAPQLRRAGDASTPVTTFRVASTSRRFDKGVGQWVDSDTMLFRVSCWRHLAENTAVSVGKGDPVIVHGRLAHREYEVDGRRHRSLDLDAFVVGPDLSRATTVFTRKMRAPGAAELAAEQAAEPESGPVTGAAGAVDAAVDRTEGSAEDGMADRAADGAPDRAVVGPAMAPV